MLNNTSMKRITKELKRDFNDIDYSLTIYHPNKRYMEVKVPILDNTMVFRISPDYPFKAPNLFVNEVNYIDRHKDIYMSNKVLIKQIDGYSTCPCCDTILCDWSPGNTLYQVVEEYLIRENIYKCINSFLSFYGVKTLLPFDDLVY